MLGHRECILAFACCFSRPGVVLRGIAPCTLRIIPPAPPPVGSAVTLLHARHGSASWTGQSRCISRSHWLSGTASCLSCSSKYSVLYLASHFSLYVTAVITRPARAQGYLRCTAPTPRQLLCVQAAKQSRGFEHCLTRFRQACTRLRNASRLHTSLLMTSSRLELQPIL